MKALPVLLFIFLFSFVSAQQTTPNSVTVFTSLVVSTGFGAGRNPTVATATILITSTLPPAASSTPTGNSTSNNNSTSIASVSQNATTSATSTLPTAPTTVTGGGISGMAPIPGETGGQFGPPDGYIAAATALRRNALLVGLGGCIIGGALIIL
ncbi:hypothetical protein F5887DRAFT_943452 [Amanita rubescens]|nr:hypothetical protein F5887DRAFT_1023185 [Amanita rubescens]KAF8350040.1 hypothetical protein F5887DRAFT_943452 [Amanita rubescens]